MYTAEDLRKDSMPRHKEFIEELEKTLKYTNQTVKRNALKKEIMFWQAQVVEDTAESNLASDKFFERYPLWEPKG